MAESTDVEGSAPPSDLAVHAETDGLDASEFEDAADDIMLSPRSERDLTASVTDASETPSGEEQTENTTEEVNDSTTDAETTLPAAESIVPETESAPATAAVDTFEEHALVSEPAAEPQEDSADEPLSESQEDPVASADSNPYAESATTAASEAPEISTPATPQTPADEPEADVANATEEVKLGSDSLTQVAPVPIEENLDDVNLADEPAAASSAAVASATNEDVSPASTPVAVVEPAAPPPPLPPRSQKKKPFAWLTKNRSSDKEKPVPPLPEEASATTGSASPTASEAGSATPPPLPPRHAKNRGLSSVSSAASVAVSAVSTSPPNYELLLSRVDATREDLQSKEQSEKEAHLAGAQKLKEEFEALRQSTNTIESDGDIAAIDWEFWTMVVADYPNMARTHPVELSHAVQNGLPPPLRGTIWQLMAASKSLILEEVYSSLLTESSPHEKGIRRDLSRTSFAKSANQDALFNIIKAYSLWDPEVGYIQGMAFIAVPLILVMKEQEAFCLLVDLMKSYNLRELYLPEMPGLHLRLYQFDRIIEDTLPTLYRHLSRQGVLSSMYASQWFLTMFAYKFPLSIVLRIFDIVVAEGLEAILRFGVALLRKNEASILELEFDALVTFLKGGLFDIYVDNEAAKSHSRSPSSLFRTSSNNSHSSSESIYRVNDLVADAYAVKILPETLKKYENEYIELHRVEKERAEEIEHLKTLNGQLTLQIKRLEASLATLNVEHIEVANEMVQGKVEIEKLKDENTDLKAMNEELTKKNEELQTQLDTLPATVQAEVEAKLKGEMDELMKRNLEVMDLNRTLEDQLASTESQLADTKVQFASVNAKHESLNRRWHDIRKVLEGGNEE